LNSISAGLYAEIFAADPQLADDLRAGHRYNAACAAALAGSGAGEDKGKLSEAERTRWRKQARAWLQADLALWAKKLDNSTASRLMVSNTLGHWQADRDLAGIREASRLKLFSPHESQECLALWKEVDAVLKRSQNTR
jgi:hypothetical protein